MTETDPRPDELIALGFAFWGSKALLTAVELDLFTVLAGRQQSEGELVAALGLQRRGVRDWLDALVSLGVLERSGSVYANAPASEAFLDRNQPTYIGGLLEMANARLYPFWGSLTDALRTGQPQNEAKLGGDFFAALYQDSELLAQFMHAMTGISKGVAGAIAEQFPWSRYSTVIDVGSAEGCVPVEVASHHRHLRGGGFDLPPVGPIFDKYVSAAGLADRLRFYSGDFFADPLPNADVLIMGHILHDWGLYEKLLLLRKAFDALPPGGALIVYDSVIDDDRRANTFGLLMSLNMLIETQEGFDYTAADCQGWLNETGFSRTYVEPLVGPDSMVVAVK
jgi:hypothetical protein